jgi:sulfide dehydrogenase cytochrome subunit
MIKIAMIASAVLMLLAGNIQAAGNVENGADLSYDCIECHGMDGEGNFETPTIAGLDEAYFIKQLRDFCGGRKESMDGMMNTYTEDRSDQELQDLAAYWASKEKPKAN